MTTHQVTQTTIQQPVSFSGKGLHSGRIVKMDILPAPADTGIVFQRTDHPEAKAVKAVAGNISSTTLSTNIGQGISSVSTVEHLLAAFAGLGITNALVKLDSPEIPILDGSAMTFVRGLLNAGQLDLDKPARYYRLKKAFEISRGDQYIRIDPSRSFSVQCSIDFPHKIIGRQSISYKAGIESFIKIARSRTFCHIRDVNAMREQGLALGGSLDNAIVLSDDGLLNEEGLHSQQEFVEHKLLDLIGDIALLGLPVMGHITAHKPGHALHAEFTKALLENAEEYLEEWQPDLPEKRTTSLPIFAPTWAQLG